MSGFVSGIDLVTKFHLFSRWKSEVDGGKDEGLAAMKEMAFNGAAKGLAKSVEKYLVDFPKEVMRSVLEDVDASLGKILAEHIELLAKCPGHEWEEAKELGPTAGGVGGEAASNKASSDSRLADLSHAVDALKLALDLDEDEPGMLLVMPWDHVCSSRTTCVCIVPARKVDSSTFIALCEIET